MKTFRVLSESLSDVSSLSHRRLKSIINDPDHPMHAAAKAEHDRRMQSEAADMAECGCGPDCDHCGGKHDMSEAGKDCECCGNKIKAPTSENTVAAMRKKLAKASAGSEKGKAKVTLPKAPWDKEKEQKEETVNELKRSTLSNYMRKSAADVAMSRGDAKRQDKRIGGQKAADEKIRKSQGYGSSAKVAAANEETVNEISIDKLSRYGKAAAKDIEKHRNTVRSALDQPASPKKAKAGLASMQKLTKRSKGSDMYVDKMTGRSKVKPSASTVGTDKQVAREGKAYGPTGVSYYVPSGHKDEVDPKTGKKYPERQKPGYKAPANEEKDTHVTKDGRTVKKGLWYYMNKRKKAGTSRPKSAGTVDAADMKRSQK